MQRGNTGVKKKARSREMGKDESSRKNVEKFKEVTATGRNREILVLKDVPKRARDGERQGEKF